MVLLWFAFLVVMAVLFERRTHWLSRFSIFTPLLGGMFIRYGIAVPFNDKVNNILTGITISHEALVNYYAALVLAYLSIYLGAVFLVPNRRPSDGAPRSLSETVHAGPLGSVALAALVLLITVWIIIPWESFTSGLFLPFSPQHTALAYSSHRAAYGSETHPSVSFVNYISAVVRFAAMPVILWILYFHRKRYRSSNVLFWISLVVLGSIGLSSGQKAPTLILLLGFVFGRLVVRGGSLLNWKALAGLGLIVLIVLPILYHFQYPTLDLGSLYQTTFFRMTGEYSRTAQLRFMFYPNLHPYLLGLGSTVVRGIASLVGFDTSGVSSPETYLPDLLAGLGSRYSGTWNSGFFAEAWADFGFAGVIGSSLIVGAYLAALYRWYENGPKGPLQNGTYVALCVASISLTDVSLLTAMWTSGLLTGLGVYWLLRLLPKARVSDTPFALLRRQERLKVTA